MSIAQQDPPASEADIDKNRPPNQDNSPENKEEESFPHDDGKPWADDLLPKTRGVWQGLEGSVIMVFGVAVPIFMAAVSVISAPKRLTLLLLNHPLETSVELILLALIPAVIYVTWKGICKNTFVCTGRRAIALGAATGMALICSAVSVAALFCGSNDLVSAIGTDFTLGFCWVALLTLAAAACGAYLINYIRQGRELAGSRLRVLAFSIVGVVLSTGAFVMSEARPWNVRLSERKALSNKLSERNEGLQDLRALDAEKELRMECSDNRAAGLAGLFMPIKSADQRAIYFAMTGKPFNFRDANNKDISTMPDDDLKRHAVGDQVPGLTLVRSSMDGVMHPNTLTSSVTWTFVFKNNGDTAQQALGEIGLPPGAVMTKLTVWQNGEAQEGTVAASGKAEGYIDSHWRHIGMDGPAIISDLGHGRALLRCSQVRPDEETKVAVTAVIPLRPEALSKASLALPTFIASNFAIEEDGHTLRLQSDSPITTRLQNMQHKNTGLGQNMLSGALSDKDLTSNSLIVNIQRGDSNKPYIVLDKTAVRLALQEAKEKEERAYQARHSSTYQQPERQMVVMVTDGKAVNQQLAEMTRALAAKPTQPAYARPIIKTVPPRYVVENIKKVASPAPRHLVVVVDGSASIKQYSREIAASLQKLPKAIDTQVVIASQELGKSAIPKVLPLDAGLKQLNGDKFIGGQNNLQAVIAGAQQAGEQTNGAVLWIHGPQPVMNEEIYILSKYISTPSFFEMQVGTGNTDAADFFKNHSEIGPFSSVPRSGSNIAVQSDLEDFFGKWQPNANILAANLNASMTTPEGAAVASPEEADELLALNARKQCADLIASRHIRQAARIATAYGIVSPVSSALTSFQQEQPEEGNIRLASSVGGAATTVAPAPDEVPTTGVGGEAPTLQGATNGTIAPQSDCVIMGVNTAGTVRVNNLANLEAMLNIIANLGELAIAGLGLGAFIHAIVRRGPLTLRMMGGEVQLGTVSRLAIGLGLIVVGLAIPGTINWFVASARDACLFN
jgi:hypothetical protein